MPLLVRSEGLAERVGDVLVQCTGGVPGTATTGNLSLLMPSSITNRVTADGLATGVTLSLDGVPSPLTGRVAGLSLTFTGVSFTVPASGAVAIRVSGLRVNINQLNPGAQREIQAFISTNISSLALANNPVTVALTQRGLLASFATAGIPCTGSPVPATIGMSELFAANTRFASTRVTEGFAAAFQRDAGSDTGIRIITRYTDLPAGARLFVPDAVSGSNSAQPTSGGDLGLPRAGGQYTPGALLLVRVMGADPNGAGGAPVQKPPAGPLNAASEVAVSGGSAYVVYEVADSNPLVIESAQWPTFIGLPNVNTVTTAHQALSFAPVSTDAAASVMAPIPRFAGVAPPADCTALGDCNSGLFPKLALSAMPIQFSSIQSGAAMQPPGYIAVRNAGGGVMPWVASLAYKNGDGWLKLETTSGINNGSVRVFPTPQNLAAGKYEATITIDAGERAGKESVPVVLLVSPAPSNPNPPAPPPPVIPPAEPPPAAPKAAIGSVYNAADARMGPLVAGSLATLRGSNFAGKTLAVTFDGIPAKLLYSDGSQINLVVPAELAGKATALVVVSVDGLAGTPQSVTLAAAAPGIFAGGVLNQDGAVNGEGAPAAPGTVLQIFATGLPASGKDVVVKIHDRQDLAPVYAGVAPGAEGVQQVNVVIPGDLPAMTTEVLVCAGQACSWPVSLTLR